VSTIRAGHDVRCERSATKPRRCQCDCGGRLHGVEATKRDMRRAHDRELITDDEYADALERIRLRVEVAR
jgi:hypothetical protein